MNCNRTYQVFMDSFFCLFFFRSSFSRHRLNLICWTNLYHKINIGLQLQPKNALMHYQIRNISLQVKQAVFSFVRTRNSCIFNFMHIWSQRNCLSFVFKHFRLVPKKKINVLVYEKEKYLHDFFSHIIEVQKKVRRLIGIILLSLYTLLLLIQVDRDTVVFQASALRNYVSYFLSNFFPAFFNSILH